MTHPNHAHTADKTIFGFWIYLMSDCVIFAGLFATYAVLHRETFGALSIEHIVNLPFVLAETLVLLTSSFTVGLALLAAQSGKKQYALGALGTTLALGVTFLWLELSEFTHLIREGAGPAHSAFLSSFFALLGTHGLHVFLGSLWMLAVMAYIARKGLGESIVRKLTLLSIFWHFLDVVWIFIFTFVYLFGSL